MSRERKIEKEIYRLYFYRNQQNRILTVKARNKQE